MYDTLSRKQWPKTTGIYRIWFENSSTGKVYVGSTSSKRGFSGRWGQHLLSLKRSKHSSIRLQNAYNKYGESGLRFEILEISNDLDYIIPLEQKYINELGSYIYGYNSTPIAGSQRGYKQSKETIDKINNTKWKKFNELTSDILSLYEQGLTLKDIAIQLGVCPNTVSKILKLSNFELRTKGDYNKIPIYQYTKSGEFIRELPSVYEASKVLNLKESHIRRVLKKKQLYTKEFHFSYDKLTLPEYEKNIIEYKKNNKSEYRPTNEHLKKMRKGQMETINPFNRILDVEQYDLNGNLLKVWVDTKEIVDFYGLKNATPVLRVIRGERKNFKKSIWKTKNYKQRNCKSARTQIQIT